MKIAVTGAGGYIGRHLLKAGCVPLKCNVLEYNDVDRAIAQTKPELVIHLAGESDPDACEKNPATSSTLNVRGTYYVMENCAKRLIPAVLLSSSQIWGGGWWESLWNRHSEKSKFTPAVNSYGSQKIAAESMAAWLNTDTFQNMKVIRTSLVFNAERFSRELSDLKHGVSIDAPTFIKRSFIHMDDFVYLVSSYCRGFYRMPHILHLAGSETVSYHDFWKEVASQFGFDRKLVRGRRMEKNTYAAKRPHNGGLDISLSQKLGFRSFNYIDGIKRMKNE